MSKMGKLGLIATFIFSTLVSISAPQVARAAAGDVDTQLNLDGSTQWGSASDASTLKTFNAISIEFWAKPTACTSGNIIGKQSEYAVYCDGGKLDYAFQGSSSWSGITSNRTIVLNEWHHYAVTRAANTNTTNVYFDGVLTYSGTADGAGTGALSANTNVMSVGSRSGQCSCFAGAIDEVRISNVARTQSEIQTDMNTWGIGSETGVVAYYDFNDISGTNVPNQVPGAEAGTNLTLVGSPTTQEISIADTTTAPGYTILKFPRSYLTANGGWKTPANVFNISFAVVGGGGGGSGGSQGPSYCESGGGGGGGGGGIAQATSSTTPGINLLLIVGMGGRGGAGGGQFGQGWGGAAGTAGRSSSFNSYSASGGGGALAEGANCYPSDGGTSASGKVAGTKSASQAGYGGGGGGDNAAGSAQTGGSGTALTILSLNVGGGGGGGANGYRSFSSGSGTDGGGNGTQDGTNAISGALMRGGGGGGGSGAGAFIGGNGGNGGSGVVVIQYKNYFGTSVSLSINPKKTTKSSASTPITATTTSTGTVTFYANGRVINGCNGVLVSGTTATCNWRPITQGPVTLTATYTSSDSLYSGSAIAPTYVTTVGKRTTAR